MSSISEEEKREAMRRVLGSRCLGRSEQVRKLFLHMCEVEMAERGHELSEHELGVRVLGRPVDYSPAEDSAVRSRMYELRSRLRAYYEGEGAGDPIRIEVDKGGYRPRFERVAKGEATRIGSAELTRELRALWGPILERRAAVLIVFEVRLFFYAPGTGLVVRDHRINDPAEVGASEPLATFRRQMGTGELRETRDYADFGAVHAAFLLGRLLAGSALEVGLKHSSALDWQDVWNHHVVFLGKPHHPIVRSLLDGKPFRVDESGDIHDAGAEDGEVVYRNAATHGAGEKYALLTRLRAPQPARYSLLLTSVAAEFMWALAECVTNTSHASRVMAPLRSPSGEYPEEFQIVVLARFHDNVPVEILPVAQRVLPVTRRHEEVTKE